MVQARRTWAASPKPSTVKRSHTEMLTSGGCARAAGNESTRVASLISRTILRTSCTLRPPILRCVRRRWHPGKVEPALCTGRGVQKRTALEKRGPLRSSRASALRKDAACSSGRDDTLVPGISLSVPLGGAARLAWELT